MASAVQPYDAWLFFAADTADEADENYRDLADDIDELRYGSGRVPDVRVPADDVRVVAVEMDLGLEHVWLIRNGKAERCPSWMVRAGQPIPAALRESVPEAV